MVVRKSVGSLLSALMVTLLIRCIRVRRMADVCMVKRRSRSGRIFTVAGLLR